jgi:hypothetical protein
MIDPKKMLCPVFGPACLKHSFPKFEPRSFKTTTKFKPPKAALAQALPVLFPRA